MTAVTWTAEQEAVLASKSRITLVQAGPGSGKTKVFAELVDRKLKCWSFPRGGLAALSFTNVARLEIESRVSAATIAPHFVGTLDAFFLRFVILPFGHLAGLSKSGARLVPSPLDQRILEPAIKLGDKSFAPLFQITAASGEEADPQFLYRPVNGMPTVRVPSHLASFVLTKKREEWKTRGRVTHGDCSYLASCILRGPSGPAVRTILAKRFPVICIDEFQDTGHFLGRAVLSILAEPSIEAIVVGDADQKIFGFSGVNSKLFDEVKSLAGATSYSLTISQRCATTVCHVATKLSRSGSVVAPKATAETGRALLAVHEDKAGDVDIAILAQACEMVVSAGCQTMAILVRKRETKRRLLPGAAKGAPPIGSRGVEQINRALMGIKEGYGRKAIEIAESLTSRILFADDRPSDDEIWAVGIDPSTVRRHVRRILMQLIRAQPGESWGQWAQRAKGLLDSLAIECGVTGYKGRLGAAFKAEPGDKPDEPRVAGALPPLEWPTALTTVEVLTIHEAKGREFDGVLLYCPVPRKVKGVTTCPSVEWWQPPEKSEEREVAFVAVTRAKRLLMVAVHEATKEALKSNMADFFALFEVIPKPAKT